jgi:hypothetical protein
MEHFKRSRRNLSWNWLAALPLTILLFHCVSAATCEGMADLKLPTTTITMAQIVAAGAFTPPTGSAAPYKDLPSFCRVAGVIRPTIDSEITFEAVNTINYFQSVVAKMGQRQMENFMRLYMAPRAQIRRRLRCAHGPFVLIRK